jgi:DNA-binding beta-propeller fold protein YncE
VNMRQLMLFLLVTFAAASSDLTVLTVSPPEVVSIDPSNWRITGRASLPAVPAAVAAPPGRQFVYVLVDGATNADGSLPRGPGKIVVFSLADRKIIASLDVGWGPSRIGLTKDERFLACFRERSPARVFERPPSLAVGAISLISQARKAHKPSKISFIDASRHKLVWQRDLDPADQGVLFSAEAEVFCVPGAKGELKLVDSQGNMRIVDLPAARGRRKTNLSPNGRWVYVIEDGRDSSERSERVSGRIFVVSSRDAAVAKSMEVEHELLTAKEGTSAEGVAVVNESGLIRNFVGAGLQWSFEAGREFLFTRLLDNPRGLLIVGRKQVSFFEAESAPSPSWTLPARFHGTPAPDIVSVSGSSIVAVPVMNTNQGFDLDRITLLDLRKRQMSESVAVGRRGRMAAKALGLAAAGGAVRGVAGPNSFSWNGFAVDSLDMMSKVFAGMVTGNPLLKVAPEGRFVYGMSRFGNDTTIIRATDSTVIGKVATGSEGQGLILAEGGLLCAWAGKQMTWIDTRANTIRSKKRPCHGRFDRVQIGPEDNWLITFGQRCAMFWDTRTGELVAAVEKLGKPRLVVGGM